MKYQFSQIFYGSQVMSNQLGHKLLSNVLKITLFSLFHSLFQFSLIVQVDFMVFRWFLQNFLEF